MGFEKRAVNSERVFVDNIDRSESFVRIAEDIASDLAFGSLRLDAEARKELFSALENKVDEIVELWGPDEDDF